MLRVWGRGEVHTGNWWGNLRDRYYLKDLGVRGRVILKWILKKWDGGMDWLDLAQDRQVADSCKFGNEPPSSIKCG
jgi:hypothetical protein